MVLCVLEFSLTIFLLASFDRVQPAQPHHDVIRMFARVLQSFRLNNIHPYLLQVLWEPLLLARVANLHKEGARSSYYYYNYYDYDDGSDGDN